MLAQKPWFLPIPGTTNAERMLENAAAADITLTESDLRQIEDGAAQIKASGERYAPAQQRLIDR